MNKEMRSLKEDYKQCVEALKKEIHARTKGENTSKVFKDIIDVQKEADDSPNVEEMEIDEATEVWI